MTTNKAPSRDDANPVDLLIALAHPVVSLPKLPPLTAELRQLRKEGVHVKRIRFDSAAAARENQAMLDGIARLPNERVRMWFWQACTINDWYEGTQMVSEQRLRRDLDRTGEFPRWADFERETIQQPLAELHVHTDFQIQYEVRCRAGKIAAVRFHLASNEGHKQGAGSGL